jgi:hypothetical protein
LVQQKGSFGFLFVFDIAKFGFVMGPSDKICQCTRQKMPHGIIYDANRIKAGVEDELARQLLYTNSVALNKQPHP